MVQLIWTMEKRFFVYKRMPTVNLQLSILQRSQTENLCFDDDEDAPSEEAIVRAAQIGVTALDYVVRP